MMVRRAQRDGPEHQALKEVLTKFDDNQSELARVLNAWCAERGQRGAIRQSTISWWLNHSYQVSPSMAQAMAAVSGVPVERLLPAVFTDQMSSLQS